MLDLLATYPPLFQAAAFVLGLLIGSFLNVVIHRLPIMMERDWQAQAAELRGEPITEQPRFNLIGPGSRCPSCGHQITSLENLPLVSYLFLRGKCSACKAPISIRYPIVELSAGLLAWVVAWKFGYGLPAAAGMGLVWALIALALIDADTQLLPDDITLPLLWAGLIANIFHAFVPLQSAVIGAIAGYLALWSVYWAFKLITGREGMGYGDFKLLAALGAWLGWQMLPVIVLLSSIVGAVIGLSLVAFRRHQRHQPLPFGPYLAGAGVLALLFGQQINARYLGLL